MTCMPAYAYYVAFAYMRRYGLHVCLRNYSRTHDSSVMCI